jgi:biotin synthase
MIRQVPLDVWTRQRAVGHGRALVGVLRRQVSRSVSSQIPQESRARHLESIHLAVPSDSERQDGRSNGSAFPVRNDWTLNEIQSVYESPLLELIFRGASVHRIYFNPQEVQQCTLLSIKTGGCPEDCKYCSQSSKYETAVAAEKLMELDEVLTSARKAKDAGSTRFCMGAAWRGVSQVGPRQFNRVLDMVSGIRGMGMEVCATLGMLNKDQAIALKSAGLTAYNHNLDTSREFYPKVITSRVYEDRLETLEHVREAGISVCCGGIIGLGESHEDRVSLLQTLATLPEHPESVPVNALVANSGTPLESSKPVAIWDMCRMIATARVVMPRTMVRLSAGRVSLSPAEQALCFLSGANSIFTGDKLLTTPNPEFSADAELFEVLGLTGKKPFFYKDESFESTEVGNFAAPKGERRGTKMGEVRI